MAACFIEELFRLGHNGERILAMFNSPQYRGPYLAKEALGEGEIKQLIEEQMCRRAYPGRRSGPGLPPPEHRPDGGAAGEDAETSPSIIAL
jgi:hypothetical protein